MIKRLVICADGTWNEPNQTDKSIPSPSNVVKLSTAVSSFDSLGNSQMIYYHSGLGAGGGLIDHLSGGAIGLGISRAIRDLYLFLVLNYKPGDELFFFGFSRGAYTVRSLAGLIRNSGILKDKHIEKYQQAYELYRGRTDETHPKAKASVDFRLSYSWPDFRIKFIGVWDTVGSLGIPFPFQVGRKIWEFHDVELSSHVDYAYQALAIDEQRKSFTPCVWVKQADSTNQILEQAWFPGVHANIGGGYRDSGLSDCALDWIWQKAENAGLALDKLQKVSANPAGILRNSLNMGYRLLGASPRTIGAKLPHSYERLSQAAIQRNAIIPSYNPRNMREFMDKNHRMHSNRSESSEELT